MDTYIKPCPFCGSSRVKVFSKNAGTEWINGLGHRVNRKTFTVRCKVCFARGGVAGGLVSDRELPPGANIRDRIDDENDLRLEAVRLWNERH